MRLASFCSSLLSETHRGSITQPFYSRPSDWLLSGWRSKVPPPKLSCNVLIFLSSGWSLVFQFYNSVVFATHLCACSVMSNSLQTHGPARLLCPWDSPGKHTGVGCHSLLQGIFPSQGLILGLLNCGQMLSLWATGEVVTYLEIWIKM